MAILEGIKNFLHFLNDNWTMIATILLLIAVLVKKICDFVNKSNEEKIAIVKKQIQQSMLKFVTEAEIDYQEWISAGAIKRSQVVNQIYEKYPILSRITDQEELIKWVDEMIDKSLDIMRDIFKENADEMDDLEYSDVE